MRVPSLDEFYDDYPRVEDAFLSALDESLNPRGPDLLFDIVRDLGLPRGADVIDAGCGEGRQAIRLAADFEFNVLGIDPVERHIELANEAVETRPETAQFVRFEQGTIEALPAADGSTDLAWCREVLVHVQDLQKAMGEIRRVLRDGGRALIHQTFATERLEPGEAAWLFQTMKVVSTSANAATFEQAIAAADLEVVEQVVVDSQWEEFAEETAGRAGRRLLHLARLLRDPERYIRDFGQTNYDIMLGDARWHVYHMIGKLSGSVYLLEARS